MTGPFEAAFLAEIIGGKEGHQLDPDALPACLPGQIRAASVAVLSQSEI